MQNDTKAFTSKAALADYLGVTRKTLYKRANANSIELNGEYTHAQLKLLSSRLDTTQSSNQNTHAKHDDLLVKSLQDQVEYLKSQLTEKDTQIASLYQALDQQQQLQLGITQQLEDANKKLQLIEAPKRRHWWQF